MKSLSEIFCQNRKKRGKSGFLRGVSELKVFIIVLAIQLMCENLRENDAKFII